MKKVEAIIRNDKLEIIKKKLAKEGFPALTTYEVKGRGKQTGIIQVYNGSSIHADLLPKTKIEIIIEVSEVDKIIEIITTNAKTSNIGDGKIFVSQIDEVIRIRDGTKATQDKEII